MMPEEPTSIGVLDGLAVVTPPVEIDILHAGGFRAALADAGSGHPVVVVDMSATVFCDSTGLRLLLQASDRAKARGGELRLVLSSPQMLRIFAVTGFDQLFPVFATLSGALAGPGPQAGAAAHERRAAARPAGDRSAAGS